MSYTPYNLSADTQIEAQLCNVRMMRLLAADVVSALELYTKELSNGVSPSIDRRRYLAARMQSLSARQEALNDTFPAR